MAWLDRDGKSRPVVDETRPFTHPRLSPDGARVVVQSNASGTSELWIFDVGRGTRLRLSSTGTRPIWTRDGKSIIVQRDGLYSLAADDGRGPELVLARNPPMAVFPLSWSLDGRTLVYSRASPDTNRDVFTLAAGEAPKPFLSTPRDERSAMLSPDGRWMVYAALEPGREEEVYVQPYPGPGERVLISQGGGREPVWSRAGNEIFYRSTDGRRMFGVDVRTAPGLVVGRPRLLFQGHFLEGQFWSNYDVTSDGRRFLMLESASPPEPRLNVVLHWIDALIRK
jgi:serine/threonine-protein kinase